MKRRGFLKILGALALVTVTICALAKDKTDPFQLPVSFKYIMSIEAELNDTSIKDIYVFLGRYSPKDVEVLSISDEVWINWLKPWNKPKNRVWVITNITSVNNDGPVYVEIEAKRWGF